MCYRFSYLIKRKPAFGYLLGEQNPAIESMACPGSGTVQVSTEIWLIICSESFLFTGGFLPWIQAFLHLRNNQTAWLGLKHWKGNCWENVCFHTLSVKRRGKGIIWQHLNTTKTQSLWQSSGLHQWKSQGFLMKQEICN